jgi:hypothetical protein
MPMLWRIFWGVENIQSSYMVALRLEREGNSSDWELGICEAAILAVISKPSGRSSPSYQSFQFGPLTVSLWVRNEDRIDSVLSKR